MLASFVFGHFADQAMDKAGFGDYDEFSYWSSLGGLAFYAAVALWVATSVALFRSSAGNRIALTYSIAVPVAFVVAFGLYLSTL